MQPDEPVPLRIRMHRAAKQRLEAYVGCDPDGRLLVELLTDPRLLLIPLRQRAEHERETMASVERLEMIAASKRRTA